MDKSKEPIKLEPTESFVYSGTTYNIGDHINYKSLDKENEYEGEIIGIYLLKEQYYITLTTNTNGVYGADLIPVNQIISKIDTSKKQKYTLEEDSKYRVKYMKYKAKYLAKKNN
jgi:hypothetical protein